MILKSKILFLLLFFFSAGYAQEESINDQRDIIDLANFLDAKLIPGFNFESELTFRFWKGKFPKMELNSPMNSFFHILTTRNNIAFYAGSNWLLNSVCP